MQQLDFIWLESERNRILFEGCDYYAVHLVGKKTHQFIANVLARDKANAIKTARRQCFIGRTKERTALIATHLGLSGYAAQLKRVSMC
jgi:hypothetical protein